MGHTARMVMGVMMVLFLAASFPAAAGEPRVSGYRWPDAAIPLTYRLNVTNVPSYMHQVFLEYGRIGLDDWAKAEGTKLTSCYRGVTKTFQKTDEKILARWNDLPTGVGGWAYYPPVGVIEYNSRYAGTYYVQRANLRNLTLHENGHAIGFPHYFDDDSVMAYKFIPALTDFDRALVRLNYPGQKITSESCCAKTDTPLAAGTAFSPTLDGTTGRWCYASWIDKDNGHEYVGDRHEN